MDSLFLCDEIGNVYNFYPYRFPLQVFEIMIEY